MKPVASAGHILPFPCASSAAGGARRKELLSALRVSASPVIVDLSSCPTLNHEDIDLLLACVAQVVGRDTQVLLVAGRRVNRLLLEVTRIASLVPVFNSAEEALAYPQTRAANDAGDHGSSQSQLPRSA
ncbi:MAG: hypothetical protein LAO30_07195 [Acidobacteriia bacterium]|nr:hypothetical protein [Terriglobia bacterium]